MLYKLSSTFDMVKPLHLQKWISNQGWKVRFLPATILLCLSLVLPAVPVGNPAAWIPARWEGGPLEVARRALDHVLVKDPVLRQVIAHWYDPGTLELLKDTPINCLLVTFSAGLKAEIEKEQHQLVKEYAKQARTRGITVLGIVYRGFNPKSVAKAAMEAGLEGLVLDGHYPAGTNVAKELEAALRLEKCPAMVISIAKEAGSARTGKSPLLAVEGVRPSARDLADMGIRAAASAEPWLESNIWLVHSFRLETTWRPVWINQPVHPNSPGDYARCVADSAVAGGRWMVALDDKLRVRLFRKDAGALAAWQSVRTYLQFAENHAEWHHFAPFGNLGIVLDCAGKNPDYSDKILKLVARRQIPYRVIERSNLKTASYPEFQAILALDLAPPREEERTALQDFAEQGGLLLVGPSWGNAPENHAYSDNNLGKGRVVVYKGELTDPELVARDLRDLLDPEIIGFTPFNVPSLLTYASCRNSGKIALIQLLNYATTPFNSKITLRFYGEYQKAQLYTPEQAPMDLSVRTAAHGRTEVTIPQLAIWGAVLLE